METIRKTAGQLPGCYLDDGHNIGLHTFMSAIFGEVRPNDCAAPIITALDIGNRMGQRYRHGRDPNGQQIYFCISTVRCPPRANILSRKQSDLVATHVIPLDDVGTKVEFNAIKLEPSMTLETSKGNFQYLYLLNQPVAPGLGASMLIGLAKAGLTDKGAIGASRVMRVPGSLNNKRGDGWRARVTSWHPGRRFTPQQLSKGLGFDYGPALKPPEPIRRLQSGEHDPFWAALERLGMVQGPAAGSSGFIPIVCPWEDGHQTPPFEQGAGYVPAVGGGAFHCFHEACSSHNTSEFKIWVSREDTRMRSQNDK
jgi:hypothetical protein